jgi:hypothetical protein
MTPLSALRGARDPGAISTGMKGGGGFGMFRAQRVR